jgi:hypothetical protein
VGFFALAGSSRVELARGSAEALWSAQMEPTAGWVPGASLNAFVALGAASLSRRPVGRSS